MFEYEREETIKKYLENSTFASVRDLAKILNVSDATIRRDISKLDEKGLVLKVFGGIASLADTQVDRSAKSFSVNKVRNVEKKRAIAKYAATMCEDGESIVVHGGTTAYMFAEEIVSRHLKVITNSMPVASLLSEKSRINLVVPGGELQRKAEILYCRDVNEADYFASKSFIGAQAFGPEGIMESNPVLVEGIRQFLNCVDQINIICDSSKFEIKARVVACPISRIHSVITDHGISELMKKTLEEKGVKVVIADLPSPKIA
tara:strand:- start:171 stop:953 length:783 start_codon:yes stop_codon:yes gene_type:complete